MIIYFSGTGNSKHAAQVLGQLLNERLLAVSDFYNQIQQNKKVELEITENERIGFVCPVHSWGLAKPMARLLKFLVLKGYSNQLAFGVFTCGDNCGRAREQLQAPLKKMGIDLRHVYSVQMPNTYIVMKGFGVDSKTLEQQKLKQAEIDLVQIAEAIKNDNVINHYVVGTKPFLKGCILYPLFMKFTMSDKKFFADKNCNSCGSCEKVCPEQNILLENGHPKWLGHCVKCLACIHRCPRRAIQYGDITQSQGRYYFGINN